MVKDLLSSRCPSRSTRNFSVKGGIDKVNSQVVIDGDRYAMFGAQIEDWNIGADRRPIRLSMRNIGSEPVITFD